VTGDHGQKRVPVFETGRIAHCIGCGRKQTALSVIRKEFGRSRLGPLANVL
jgi:hypothetical protein